MDTLLQQIVNGIVQGSVYAMVALGYTMVYGILGLINFAHGEVVMVGAMVALSTILLLIGSSLPPLLILLISLITSIVVCMALGYSIERIAYRPLRKAPRLAPLITAIGVSIVLQNLAMIFWGREYHAFPPLLPNSSHMLAGAIITEVQILIVLVALGMMGGLLLLMHRTRLGRAMRAVAENPSAAVLMGVNVNGVISITFMLGSALAAVAGIMVSANYGIVHYSMGSVLGLKAFTAAVLGGIGNMRGAMVGGLLLGLIESLGAGYIGDLSGGFLGSHYQDVFAFFVLISVLIFRPSGLLGERVAERA
ncbi:branched chain amino acid/phenylalanine ABC transporter membrane subunit LivH [Candidatus Nitrotoga sp. BS]|uniref:branched-chain amino acid ABC transporter permease n=1 Tax=Candidatus Nitrotoga sp. BS TaxID=2890408 RepID=UPI001EF2AFE3|nr:branched-chain amino acid ABC transporter permease [Candidatus Nitrotoga sp. BS]CAH1189497.1 branched chain amino acid/phenylalanine ABC transporter membrane subunit LivH [Candidatus Nitrotoga sp. BS]